MLNKETHDQSDLGHLTFAQLLAAFHPILPRALVDGNGWGNIINCAGKFPASVALATFGFEFRLENPEPVADLFLSGPIESDVAGYMRKLKTGNRSIEQSILLAPESGAAAELAIDQPHIPGGYILEFDLIEDPSALRQPGIFLILPRNSPDGYRDPEMLISTLGSVSCYTGYSGLADELARLIDSLRPPEVIVHAGIFPGRGTSAIRLLIHAADRSSLESMLRRIGWGGPWNCLSLLPRNLSGDEMKIVVNVDLAPHGVSPRIGLEIHFAKKWLSGDQHMFDPILKELVESGMCLPGKARALTGIAPVKFAFGKTGMFGLRQGIHHVKLSILGDKLDWKAYSAALLWHIRE